MFRKKKIEYNLKVALKISAVLYVCTFVLGVFWTFLTKFLPRVWLLEASRLWILGALGSVLLTSLGALWYFHSSKVAPNLKTGLLFGIISVFLGLLLDGLILTPLVIAGKQAVSLILNYYSNPLFGLTLLLVLACSAVTGFSLYSRKH